jgi:ribosomal protein L11 methyltransferase
VTPSDNAPPPSAPSGHSLTEGQGDAPASHRPEVAWLELSVEADIEAVEAVSEILGRVATGGVSVEPGFELEDEGLGARVDPTRPVIVRGYLPARDPATAEAAAAIAGTALGRLRAFDLRPIGPLGIRTVGESDWAEAWKAHFPVLRVGRRLVIRPSWRRHRATTGDVVVTLDPGMAFGTGLHPTTRLCLAAVERLADGGELGSRVLDVGAGSGILSIAAARLGADHVLAIDTDPIAIEATVANTDRNGLAGRITARHGSLPSGDDPFDVVLANLVGSILIELAPVLARELVPGGRLVASGIFVDREAEVASAFAAARVTVHERDVDGDWVALTGTSAS